MASAIQTNPTHPGLSALQTQGTPPPSFESLGVSSALASALKAMAITSPSQIQQRAIPDILAGHDCIGSSHTGSGKTMAFAIPIIQALAKDPTSCFCLILTPTRELAFQIGSQFKVLGTSTVPGFTYAVIVGGMDMMAQALELNRLPHIIIATPGRLVDHLKSTEGEVGKWNLRRCKFLVLDEADRMLTATFAEPLAYLMGEHLPPPAERQTLLFTATVTDPVMALTNKTHPGKPKPVVHLCGATRVNLPPTLKQFYSFIPSQVREVYLYYLLLNLCDFTGLPRPPRPKTSSLPGHRKPKRLKYSNTAKRLIDADVDFSNPVLNLPQTIIFVSKSRTAELLHVLLSSDQLPFQIGSRSLHSDLNQSQRLQSIKDFQEERQKIKVLISTDLGSRGLDLKRVQAVINWDLPLDPMEYIHRAGRTARQQQQSANNDGAPPCLDRDNGVCISLVTERDVNCFLNIEKTMSGSKLAEIDLKEKEEQVLEFLNPVTKAKREAILELDEMKFGERKRINKLKSLVSRKSKTVD